MIDVISAYRLLPGKTGDGNSWLPLWMHLEDTAAVMKYLCMKRVPLSVIRATGLEKEEFYRIADFLARVHDLGKCTPLFASKIMSVIPERRQALSHYGVEVPVLSTFTADKNVPHALAGEILLHKYNCPEGICAIVGAHHGKPSSEADESWNTEVCIETCYSSYYAGQKEIWEGMRECLINDALEKAGFIDIEHLPVLPNSVQMVLSGLLIQADWIASNTYYFPLLNQEDEGMASLYPYRCECALRKLTLPDAWHAQIEDDDINRWFRGRFGFEPNDVQKTAISITQNSSQSGGLMIIEAQMGVGKTEAALAASEVLAAKNNSGGLFFGLPTQATSNGLFPRLAEWADRASQDGIHAIRLVHGMAELNDDYQALNSGKTTVEEDGEPQNRLTIHSWFSGKKQALLADFVVGTVDSALMAALKQKHVMLRQLGLSGKVVVVDECHAYDAYMSRFLICLLQWLGAYHTPVILLSATLPEEKKIEMLQAYCMPYADRHKRKKEWTKRKPVLASGYPVITWVNSELWDNSEKWIVSKSIVETGGEKKVEIERIDENMLSEIIRVRMSMGGCTGIIVNTVKRAQTIAAELKELLPDKKIYVYHAQFITEERIRREKELMHMIGKRSIAEIRNNVIVVGTQVLEQSLDIDFDYLITDLCPMDLLLQRMGRLHRHERVRPSMLEKPLCGIIVMEGEYCKESVSIYGEWLLKQTRRYLKQEICLPNDIPVLVNNVYAEPEEEDKDYSWKKFYDRTEIKEGKANNWCLPHPKNSRREAGNSLVGMLDDSIIDSDKKAEASVRDGMQSIDVLVMQRIDDTHIGTMPWISDLCLRMDSIPSEEEARCVALQRLRLPYIFGVGSNFDEVIAALEQENQLILSQWQESPWLKGELILLLDENGKRNLCGYRLYYDKDEGLISERIGD